MGILNNFITKIKECCTRTDKFKEFITGKKELLPYLPKFFVVTYAKESLKKNRKGNMVKTIYIYDYDEYGERTVEEKPYSKEKVFALREVQGIPGADITGEVENSLPIYSKTSLMEVSYI